ncbi:MAG: hypothetical protein M3N52_12015 [Actinomycetota bacterium]|nr:hypothetical protein [Actinomycetota bacterium]
MSTRKGIKVNVSPVADRYAAAGERIVEFSSTHGGGLISFTLTPEGTLRVEVYQQDDTVEVHARRKEGL